MENQTANQDNLPAVNSQSQFTPVNLNDPKETRDLYQEGTEVPVDLMADYWTPEAPGENKRVYFDCLRERLVEDKKTGDLIPLVAAYFVEKKGEEVKFISNASRRLVGIFEGGTIPRGTPVSITYLGDKRNKTNDLKSATWSVKPILLNIG